MKSICKLLAPVLIILLQSFTPLSPGDLDYEVLHYTNQFRKARGLAALQMRKDICAIARQHSIDMANGKKKFGHGGFYQREARLKSIIVPYHAMAENVAFGTIGGKEAVKMWKQSRGHRRNLLGNYKYIGIGSAKDRRGRIYYTQIFAL